MNPAIETIEKEVLNWNSHDRVILAERILSSVEDFSSIGLKKRWEEEIQRRVDSIRNEDVEGLDAGLVLAKARESLNA